VSLLDRLRRQRFTILLAALGLLFVLAPLLRVIAGPRDGAGAQGLLIFGFLAALLACAHAVSESRRSLVLGALLVLALVVLQSLSAVTAEPVLIGVHHALAVIFLIHVSVQVLRHLAAAERMDFDMVSAALCLYLVAGLAWALVYSLVELADPGSFSASFATASEPFVLQVTGGHSADAFYFSFVTLTTLGFGDIIPTTPATRLLVVAEALMGQLYLAVLVARVVGLQVAAATGDSK
jgi:hypothetical protein